MPVVSQAQNRFFRACQADRSIDGCPPEKVVDEFISATHGKKVRRLPAHKSAVAKLDGQPCRKKRIMQQT